MEPNHRYALFARFVQNTAKKRSVNRKPARYQYPSSFPNPLDHDATLFAIFNFSFWNFYFCICDPENISKKINNFFHRATTWDPDATYSLREKKRSSGKMDLERITHHSSWLDGVHALDLKLRTNRFFRWRNNFKQDKRKHAEDKTREAVRGEKLQWTFPTYCSKRNNKWKCLNHIQ